MSKSLHDYLKAKPFCCWVNGVTVGPFAWRWIIVWFVSLDVPTRFLNLLIHVFKVLFPSLQPYFFFFQTIASANMRSWVHVWWSTSVWMNAIQTKRNGWKNDIEKKNLSSADKQKITCFVWKAKRKIYSLRPLSDILIILCVFILFVWNFHLSRAFWFVRYKLNKKTKKMNESISERCLPEKKK